MSTPSGDNKGRKKKAPEQSSSRDEVDAATGRVKKMGIKEQKDIEPKLPAEPWQGLYHGDVIKRMIADALKRWCKDKAKPKIYIVTPFIDKDGLEMIKKAIGSHKIEALYTRDPCHYKCPLKPQMEGNLLKENISKLMIGNEDAELYFHCKLVAAEFSDRVEILMTSANLTVQHFGHCQIDSVVLYTEKKPDSQFVDNHLKELDLHCRPYDWSKLCKHCGLSFKTDEKQASHENDCIPCRYGCGASFKTDVNRSRHEEKTCKRKPETA